jgi:hypothetical protein
VFSTCVYIDSFRRRIGRRDEVAQLTLTYLSITNPFIVDGYRSGDAVSLCGFSRVVPSS